ncbi:MAG: SDR family oxidoreductase [Planctomycetes bacterium]|jgi:NAD(P)-dependent dehydrogenase (short-subunit alcohol dehydrogenase family)|nr:SDR family oxidoreductase [Planctomycetota bacterium]
MTDSVHLVFGATSGMAPALARRLLAAGARLVLAARRPEALAGLAAETGARLLAVDARDFDAVRAAAEETAREEGRLDGMVNLAGSLLLKPAHLTSADEYRAVLDANLTTAFAVVRAAGTVLRKTGGAVVLISSAAARIGFANHEAIAAAKAGVQGLVLSAAASYGAARIRINAVAPGLVRTPLSARLVGTKEGEDRSAAMHAIGRIGEPDDVAAAIAWLLDPAQGFVTGQVLGVDGGLGVVRSR